MLPIVLVCAATSVSGISEYYGAALKQHIENYFSHGGTLCVLALPNWNESLRPLLQGLSPWKDRLAVAVSVRPSSGRWDCYSEGIRRLLQLSDTSGFLVMNAEHEPLTEELWSYLQEHKQQFDTDSGQEWAQVPVPGSFEKPLILSRRTAIEFLERSHETESLSPEAWFKSRSEMRSLTRELGSFKTSPLVFNQD